MCKGIETDTLFAYSAVYLNGLRLFVFEYAMITKADDMCQNEVF